MGLIEAIHGNYVFRRRVRVLSGMFANLIPENASVLDVGCGDGSIDSLILGGRPDVRIRGVDILARKQTRIPVDLFDGKTLPFATGSFDVVLLVDVLHHSEEPAELLSETARVSRGTILLKDHVCDGAFDRSILAFMDWVGNARHGVALPSNYWSRQQWQEAFAKAGLVNERWNAKLYLYAWPAGWIFDRSLHFMVELEKR